MSENVSKRYELSRTRVKNFIGAKKESEIIFTKGATESINFVASSYLENKFNPGDEIIVSEMEHHSNIVPWQMLAKKRQGTLKIIPVRNNGELDLEVFKKLMNHKTKLIALTHASNVLGTINPVKTFINLAHENNIPVLIDGTQATPHFAIDVTQLECDFYVFSAHKLAGPLGIGVLYIQEKHQDAMIPYQFGGDMIETVSFEQTTFKGAPQKFEAGTPHIIGAIGLATAIEFIQSIGFEKIQTHEKQLSSYFLKQARLIKALHFLALPKKHVPVFSFNVGRIHPHDFAHCLAEKNIAIRAGHHCAMPLIKRFKVPAALRVSLALYNTTEEIDRFFEALIQIKEDFKQYDL